MHASARKWHQNKLGDRSAIEVQRQHEPGNFDRVVQKAFIELVAASFQFFTKRR